MNKILQKCALCQNERKLVKSHIFPEFFYQFMYDEDHKYLFITSNPDTQIKKRPKGIWEPLLCYGCDQQIGVYEDYAAKQLVGDGKTAVNIEKYKNGFVIYNLDYAKFKLFQISLLWRSSITKRPEFHRINLGPHQERMRKMLFDQNPGKPHQYGAILMHFPEHREMLQGFLYPPELLERKIEGHRVYRAVFLSLVWIYFVSSHTNQIIYDQYFLSEDGTLFIRNAGEKSMAFLYSLAKDLTENRKIDL